MTSALSPHPLATAPVLAHVVRSGFVESVHHALAVVTAPDGAPVLTRGDVTVPVLPRSSNKPLQSVAMLRHGLDLDGELLALACASHSGEAHHRDAARRILATVGLGEEALQNTPDRPIDPAEQERWAAERRAPAAVAQNCSGKHAAMLATCVAAGWATEGYLSPEHPLQQGIGQVVAELAEEPVAAVTVDGCGAPAMAISLLGLARAFGRVASAAPQTPEGRVATAMRDHPEYVGGTGRDVTDLMRAVPGLIAKDGAEAVYAVGLADGRGVAVKVTDGNERARTVITSAVLRSSGVGPASALARLEDVPVLGHGSPVGRVVAVGV